ncbi:MFS transporter [Chondromyces apiculatus]|uniref:Transporter, MFS superfamily n=1 Tax=Chondromyces apiculatus DSM 436 TaxID=1192034 RepID=A0A017T0F9_9BACT|nr:MFS transporter [Chondromyces apiculatus]EYF02703.1 transporter, MFS superfamily [Chondromyces apiculatus DSM 436]
MSPVDPHLSRLFRGTHLFGLACGISIALTSLHLDAQGYSKQDIGTLAIFFASGLVLFAIPIGFFIRKFGGKRTLTTVMLGYAACVAAFPFMPSYGSIAGLRFFDGLFSVGVWVSSETILLHRTDKEHKAHLTSLYAIWLSSGYVIGPILAMGITKILPVPAAFVIAGVFALVSTIYLALRLPADDAKHGEAPGDDATTTDGPALARTGEGGAALAGVAGDDRPSSLTILWRIKTSCFGAYAYGYFQASLVLFLPLFLIESKGIPRGDTIILPGLFCLGMLVFSNVFGRIADRVGHLRVVRILSFGGMCCALGFVFLDSYWLMCAAVIGAGATLASMSPIALALTGVVTHPRDYSRANSIYNVFYAGGMLMGPPIVGMIFKRYGGEMMLYHLGAMWAVFVAFTMVFYRDDPASRGQGPAAVAPPTEAPAGS